MWGEEQNFPFLVNVRKWGGSRPQSVVIHTGEKVTGTPVERHGPNEVETSAMVPVEEWVWPINLEDWHFKQVRVHSLTYLLM